MCFEYRIQPSPVASLFNFKVQKWKSIEETFCWHYRSRKIIRLDFRRKSCMYSVLC